MAHEELTLAIDVGTGSVRAALVDARAGVQAIATHEHAQIVPAFGWAEQRAQDWWLGVQSCIRQVLEQVPGARGRVGMVVACGQMHGTVLIDRQGALARPLVPLWNDKRTAALVHGYEAAHAPADYLPRTANPATPAWPGFKLQWLRQHDPAAYERTACVCAPKDYINFCLTGVLATDRTEAACSFLMDPRTQQWSAQTCAELGIDPGKLAPIRAPLELLGSVTASAASATGLREGTPVLVGASDFAAGLLGSGACRTGMASEMLGTSCIVTLLADAPLLHPEVCNLGTVQGGWGAFMLLESGGDAVRWARRALHGGLLGDAQLMAHAEAAPPGAGGLLFMPYLGGQRLGAQRNVRAQFFGLGAAHGPSHLARAVLEGVALACQRHLQALQQASGTRIERIIASGGGVRNALWLKIKASAYGLPLLVPGEAECGVIGCAAMGQAAMGRYADVQAAAQALVRWEREIQPDPAWQAAYARMQPVFDRLYHHSQALCDDLDALSQALEPA
ncbi:xylulokinase [Delftia sp. PS-11]|uniref:xylulokinase n=1 Tax=Delftia sp. PS-11 TaxID=2767222 RepID=UPI0024580ED8|nr:FGGY family carbohydrate kinase [Delftia sp. PS-11]KAJ8743517.1 pentose kinase [Delftia sp. PS-11]